MKKFLLAAVTVAIASMSLSTVAVADDRNGGDQQWRHGGRHMQDGDRGDRNDRGDRDRGDRDRGDRDRGDHDGRGYHDGRGDRWRHNDGWRHDRWRHDGWRRDGWHGGYWGGPRVVIQPGYYDRYCFVKKVVRYDDWGNAYIRKVRVCR